MQEKPTKHLSIDMDPSLHYKLCFVAKQEDRNAKGQILHLIRACIRDFEARDGEIILQRGIHMAIKKEDKCLSIRIDDVMLDKLHVIADYEGRSANSEILILIRNEIEKYEQRHGEIQISRK